MSNKRVDATEAMVWVCLRLGGEAWTDCIGGGELGVKEHKGCLVNEAGGILGVRRDRKYQIKWPDTWTLPSRVAEIDPEAGLWLQTEACLLDGFALGDDLNECFCWEESKQGYKYWDTLHEKLDAKEADQKEPEPPEPEEGYEICGREDAERYDYKLNGWRGMPTALIGVEREYTFSRKIQQPKAKMTRVELHRDGNGDIRFDLEPYYAKPHTIAPSVKGFAGFEYEGHKHLSKEYFLYKHSMGATVEELESGEVKPIYPVAFYVMTEEGK